MGFLDKMLGLSRRISGLQRDLDAERERVDRLEIQVRALAHKLTAQEGLHDALAAKVHGGMGGRPRKVTNGTPLPLGASIFPSAQE